MIASAGADDGSDVSDTVEFEIVSIPLGHYDHHPLLCGSSTDGSDGVDGEASAVAAALEEFGGQRVPWDVAPLNRDRVAVTQRLARWAAPDRPRNTVLHWVGHGWSNDYRASLALQDSQNPVDATGLTPDVLAGYIRTREACGASGDSWATILIDGCRSARFAELLHAALLRDDPHAPKRVLLFGVSREGETQLGTLSKIVQLSLASFQGSNEIRLWDMADQLRHRLPDSYVFPPHTNHVLQRRTPVISGTNAPLDIYEDLSAFLRSLSPAERLHLIPQARSAEHGDTAWYFVGRQAEKERITAWLRDETPGLLVVMGEGGQGKSALLGHIAALSRPRLRELLLRGHYIAEPPQEQTPPDHSFDGIVHATGMDRRAITEAIASAAGYPSQVLELYDPDALIVSLTASLREREQPGKPFTLLVDALDEADEPRAVAEVLAAIAALPRCQVLVGTRPLERRPGTEEPVDLLSLLAPDGLTADNSVVLTRDHQAVYDYVKLRLTDAPQTGLEARERDLAAMAISTQDPDFLGARLAVHEVLSRVTNADQLADVLRHLADTGLGDHALFTAALTRITATTAAAEPLLTALAMSEGRGLPRAGGVWAAAASGIAGQSVTEADIDRLLRTAAPYVLIDSEDGSPVFRLSHEVFRDLMHEHLDPDAAPAVRADIHHRIALGLAKSARLRRQERTRLPEDRVPSGYVRRHWAEHAARGAQLEPLLADFPELVPFLDAASLAHHSIRLTTPVVRTMLRATDLARSALDAVHAVSDAPQMVALWASRLGARDFAAACADPPARPGGPAWHLAGAWWSGLRPRQLPEHDAGITALCAATFEGTGIVISADADGTLKLTGPKGWTSAIETAGRRPSAVALTSQAPGLPLVLACHDARLHAWNHKGEKFPLDMPAITAFTVAPEGMGLIAATAAEAEIRHWGSNVHASGTEKERRSKAAAASRRIGWHHDTVLSLAAMDTDIGHLVLSGSADHSARLWNLRDGSLRAVLGHTAPVRAVALGGTRHQPLAATATADQLIEVWEAPTGERVHRLMLPSTARCVAFGQLEGRLTLVAGCDDGRMRLWEMSSGNLRRTVDCHAGPVTALAVRRAETGGREQYVTGGSDGRVRTWDVHPVQAAHDSGHSGALRAMCWTARSDGRQQLITVAEGDDIVHLWDTASGTIVGTTSHYFSDVRSLQEFGGAGAGRAVLLDGIGRLWLLDTKLDTVTFTPLRDGRGASLASLTAVAVCGPDSSVLACARTDGSVQLLDPFAIETVTPERQIDPDTLQEAAKTTCDDDRPTQGPVPTGFRLTRACLQIGYHASRVVTYEEDGQLQAWDHTSGRTLWSVRPSKAPVGALATGRWGAHDVIALGTTEGVVRVHNLHTGVELAVKRLHVGPVSALALCNRGEPTLVSAGMDGRVTLWSAGAEVLTLTGHAEAARCIAVDAHAEALATGGADGTLSLWKPHST
ncbi:AAA family ATPase [Streptomyces parvulus]|uniref:AAA family ATPase n=1 Tax=Streptomyces parvulus TaxID=146923 RepID=UPI0033D3369B